ncbi:PREDICTED: something about silencing protein 10 [Cyphomyrmex costatus]|uniref:something about silencing protein 10 n=1 Tax=Cyphomyrmex costatus TaxID=456900 RepID=UPI00085222F8|nr:PREDICTED: something about silencing protein 10 [Cyphomyrmex costatus]
MARKKRTRKPLIKDDVDDMEDDIEDVNMNNVTDSEEEYTETEKKLLEKVRKQHTTENFDSDDEVLGLEDENEEESDDQQDLMESDIEGIQEDYDMPNDRAWGSKAKAFYSSDFKYTDYASAPQKDLINAEMEEEEGKKLHLRAMGQHLALDGSNLNKNMIAEVIKDNEVVQEDIKQVSDKESFVIMVNTYKEYMMEAENILAPFLELVKDGTCPECNAVTFIRTKYKTILNYCTNISFCLMLKEKELPIKTHPVVKRLEQYHQLLNELQSEQGDLLEQVTEILKAVKENRPLYSISDGSLVQSSKKTPRLTNLTKKLIAKRKAVMQEDKLSSNSTNEETRLDEELDTEEEYNGKSIFDEKDDTILNTANEDAKRAITYQMAKNRGLTPYRKKELRNPRVKHRNKYRKALIRRKGAVREVRKELTRYAGEISGIKAGVKKGIKLK